MPDKTTKALLTVIAVCLMVSVLRPNPTPAQAQGLPLATNIPTGSAPQLAVNGGTIYVLQNGKLFTYVWEDNLTQAFIERTKSAKLRLIRMDEVGPPVLAKTK